MFLVWVSLVALLIATTDAAPTVDHVLHQRRDFAHSNDFIKRAAPQPGTMLPVRIGMTQTNLAHAHDLLMEVASPTSPKYGQYYTAEQVIALFAPSDSTVRAVSDWLHSHGLSNHSQSANKQWMQIDATVNDLEELLRAKYHEYEHADTGALHIGCDEYYLPSHMQQHIDYVTPGIHLVSTTNKVRQQPGKSQADTNVQKSSTTRPLPDLKILASLSTSSLQSCDEVITPNCIFAMYNFTHGRTAMKGNELGIYEGLGQYYSVADLNAYFESFARWVPNNTHPVLDSIDGGIGVVPSGQATREPVLDFEPAIPLIYPQKTILYDVDDTIIQGDFQLYSGFLNNLFYGIDGSYCNNIAFGESQTGVDPQYPDNVPGGFNHSLQCGVYKPTKVISISYGADESTQDYNYQRRQCNEILKLGLQGSTVVASSGDIGVGDFSACPNRTVFLAQYPANCPYVLTVGATHLPPGHDVRKDQEEATVGFPSGGGFSNIYPAPDYQAAVLRTYFDNYDPGYPFYNTSFGGPIVQHNDSVEGVYNRAGRAYPDIAALGDNYLIIRNGGVELGSGTSISAPIIAAILTRINEDRLLAKRSSLGFVNPALYANPDMFHDITVGNNPGCLTLGFECVKGWDPVTGLGTPRYDKMLEYFMSLP